MAREYELKPAPAINVDGTQNDSGKIINRRQFLKYGFNTATGVLAASLGVLGFTAIILPPGGSESGGTNGVVFWAKGREDEAWYGAKHELQMTKADFVNEAAKSSTGTAGAAGIWNGVPVIVVYVDHEKYKETSEFNGKARFQMVEGYDETGKRVGHFEDLSDLDARLLPSENLVIIYGRCTHLCCIPGWQLVSNSFTDDSWTPGGGDDGGTKLFCICHSSRFDPTVLEMNSNRNRSNGATFNYAGIKVSGGPAPVGLPIIPVQMNGDNIEGLTDYLDWYTYCD